MAASRTSAMHSLQDYQGSKRGRPIANNMGWEMFADNLKSTYLPGENIVEELNNDRRDTLKDYSPEQNTLFAYEEPRRNTYAKSFINLRDGGKFGSTTDPYTSQNGDGPDISFTDKDPRGYLTEIPWQEYRRLQEVNLSSTDFKSDADNSVVSSGIHPNTMYSMIRDAQTWTQARLKIFSEEYEGKQNGGVGMYPNVSKIYKSDMEDTSAAYDGTGPSKTFNDDETPQHHNVNISNVVHLGSKFLRVNNTTDHLVNVSAYGKLYKNHGLLPHESQMRILTDDTPWGKLELRQTPKNLVKMMASQIYSDNPNISEKTAAEISRILRQDDQTEEAMVKPITENMQNNRSQSLTKDIMALFGFTDNEVKFLESYSRTNKKAAEHMVANLYSLAAVVDNLTPNQKLELKNELILRSAGMGLYAPKDLGKVQEMTIVNPKIIQFMSNETSKAAPLGDKDENRNNSLADPENKLDKPFANVPLFVAKSSPLTDIMDNKHESIDSIIKQDTTKKVAVYKNLNKYAQRLERNKNSTTNTQIQNNSSTALEFTRQLISKYDPYNNMHDTKIDNDFGENKALTRHIGRIGTKNMRKHMASDYQSTDKMNELSNGSKKNPKNIEYAMR